MSRYARRMVSVVICLTAAAILVSCGGSGAAPISGAHSLGQVSVSITPPAMTVGTTTTEPFTAIVANSGDQTVQWQVDGVPGGAAITGTIDSQGNYTAPQYIPKPPTVTITAVANADTTKSGSATATIVGTQFPAQVFMSPSGNAYVQAGTQMKLSGGVIGPSDVHVDWQVNGVPNGNSALGTIVPNAFGTAAVYTAPATVPNPPVVTIKAVSRAEPSKFTFCKATISKDRPTIATVTVVPVVGLVQAQHNLTFTTDVINVTDTSVYWMVTGLDGDPTVGGSTIDGTIGSQTGATGIYTAPAQVPSLGSAITLTAVSNEQPSRRSFANINITPPLPLGINIQLKGQQNILTGGIGNYQATVGNANVQNVTWQVNGITGGTATLGKITQDPDDVTMATYAAPTTAPTPPVVVIGAIPAANPKLEATIPLTITPPQVAASVVCFPVACLNGTEQLGINDTQQFLLQVTGLSNQDGTWYVCTKNTDPSNCTFGGNATLGTISPDEGTDLVTYTAPPSVPNPATVIIKAIPDGAPSHFATATVTISPNQVSVQVMPPGPLTVQTGELGGPFTANVIGSQDQNVSWYVNNILNGDSTVGTMMPDGQNLNEEDYIAPANVPNPATVVITAVPEADPSVVSNSVSVKIIPAQNNITLQISPNPPPPLQQGQSNPNFFADVENTTNHAVTWSLLPAGGGVCTQGLPTPCGTINPTQTNGTFTTYTAPDVLNLPDPYYVNITATSQADPTVHQTVKQEITANAQASISIVPSSLNIQAGSQDLTTFSATAINIADFDQQNVSWTMSCNSLAPTGENCGKPFGQYKDKGGPGCFDYPGDGGIKVCNTQSFTMTGGQQGTYTAPGVLGTSYVDVPQCNTQPGQTDGFVAVTIVVTGIQNCPGQNGTCQATMCIDISPPSPKQMSESEKKPASSSNDQ